MELQNAHTDNFDEEFGKRLAKLRCDYKIAIKRYKYARSKEFNDALEEENVKLKHCKSRKYLYDAYAEKEALKKELDNIINNLK